MTHTGLIGIGIMGSAMATHLLAAGHDVVGHDTDPDRRAKLATTGGTAARSAAEVAATAEVVILSLPTADAVTHSCTEIAEAGRRGTVVVETSTMPTAVKFECRDRLADAGIDLLDCPLSGTGAQALTGDVVVYGSGDAAVFEATRPVLEAFSRSVRYLGPFGNGSVMKFVANLLVAVHNVSTAEAFALGIRAGLDRTVLWESIRVGAGGSVIFDKRGPLMIHDEYLPATAKVSMFVKDVGIVRDYAHHLNLPTPLLDVTASLYDRAEADGLGDHDAAALLTLLAGDRLDDRSAQ
ncbi:MAG TPA: NAD(P)-dependent oxidoreductase [Pseudonocardiaceae bacterium]|jgi:3-hydroxyisobutyrate dehydrogenase-like beta-hydroxyacid dehydrogenase|nr:NAD(P)-dependent oxidoreductase [Pseudonocardiaceae bacterium]